MAEWSVVGCLTSRNAERSARRIVQLSTVPGPSAGGDQDLSIVQQGSRVKWRARCSSCLWVGMFRSRVIQFSAGNEREKEIAVLAAGNQELACIQQRCREKFASRRHGP